jgi:hypothetical protein
VSLFKNRNGVYYIHYPIPQIRYLGPFGFVSQAFSRLGTYPQPVDKGIGKMGVAKSDTPKRYLKAIPISSLL